MEAKNERVITEKMVSRYSELYKQSKHIEKEMGNLKKIFHDYFDQSVGSDNKGELDFKHFKLQRQIRKSENFISDATVEKLEFLNLTDCIEIVRKPHDEKIKSAIALGFLNAADLEDCISRKFSAAIVVKEK